MNRITVTWQNGCFDKMDAHPVHTIPNHHTSKIDVLQKSYVQIILPAAFKYVPQPTATTFAFSSVFILLLYY